MKYSIALLVGIVSTATLAFGQSPTPEKVFLLKAVSVMSDTGVASFPAMKEYAVVTETETDYVLETVDKRPFAAKKTDTTTDPNVIAALSAKPAPTPAPAPVAPVVAPVVQQVAVAATPTPTPDQQTLRAEKARKIQALELRLIELKAAIKKGGSDTSPENRKRMAEKSAIQAEIRAIQSQ